MILGLLDWVVIGLFFISIFAIGFYLKRFSGTGEGFFLAGRSNGAWAAGIAFLSANLGTIEILGWTGGAMKYGIHVCHFYWIGAVPAMLFLGLYMMPFYYNSKVHSIPEYLRLRFDERTRMLNAVSFAFMTVLMSGVNLYMMALVFRSILGWNWELSLWVGAVSVGFYIVLGGLLSAIFTEIVQFFLIWAGLLLVAILAIWENGGVGGLVKDLPAGMTHLWASTGTAAANPMEVGFGGIILGLGFVLSFGYWTTNFLVVQRALSSKDLRAARLTPITAAYLKMFLPIIVVGAGLAALKLFEAGQLPLLPHPGTGGPWNDTALPLLIARYYPEGLAGLGITALLAGFMAGQAGNISAFNTVWTYDIYRPLFAPKASEKHLVLVGRISTIAGILISVGTAYLAMNFDTIMDYIQAIFSWINAPLFAVMLLGMFWKRATPTAAFVGLGTGMVASFTLFMLFRSGLLSPQANEWLTGYTAPGDMSRNFWQAVWSFGLALGLTFGLSFVTRRKPEAELEGLVRGCTDLAREQHRGSWFTSPGFFAAVALGILLALNLLFW
jgi:SSS family solute:Na+ symporter